MMMFITNSIVIEVVQASTLINVSKVTRDEVKDSFKALYYDGELTEQSNLKELNEDLEKEEFEVDLEIHKDNNVESNLQESNDEKSNEAEATEKIEDSTSEKVTESEVIIENEIQDTNVSEKDKEVVEDNSEEISSEEIKNCDILDVAVVGLLDNGNTDLSYDNIKSTYDKIPEGTGIWILEKDREIIVKIINSFANKEYYVDLNGFLQSREVIKNCGSSIYSETIDKLIASDKVLIVGRSNGWNEYDSKEQKVVR